jgi:PAS domain S-box-containing protein
MKSKKPPGSVYPFEDTESISVDLKSLFSEETSPSGSFYIKDFHSTLFGRLLQALPIPALLIDQAYRIFFANQACGRISRSYDKIVGESFSSLFPYPDTAVEMQRAAEEVFSSRKPQVRQALLKIEKNRIWGRINFRAVRTAQDRLILLLIEDLSVEKRQILLSQKYQHELRKEITERKRAEKALRDSEALLRSMLATSPVGIGLSEDRIMKFVNDAWLEMFGFENEAEVAGQSARIIYPSDEEFKRVGEILYESLKTGEVTSTDVTFKRKDGTLFDAHIRMKALDTPGLPKATMAAISDISERKQAEQALKESEERFRSVVQDQTELICRLSTEKRFSFVNEAFCRYFGVECEKLVGEDVLPLVPKELRADVDNCLASISIQNPVSTYEIQVRNRDQERRWLKWTGRALVDDEGNLGGFQFVGQDITDQKRAEEALRQSEKRFRAIFEGAEDFIFLKDRSLRYSDVNPAGERLLGVPASEIIGSAYEDLFGHEDAEYLRDVDARVLQGESVQEEHTIKISGVPVTLLDTRVPLRDDTGEIVGVLTIARDISDRKRIELSAEATEEYASRAMQATLKNALLAARKDVTVLLTGESGSGKDYLARHIHNHSNRANGPYFSINCAAISPELAESELFGHERGAFTGAVNRKRGLLELAEGGTLLLNEIGELSTALQAKLLTFLDTRKFTRVGGEKEISVNARLIAATNRDLHKEVELGRFRRDLFYRLNVMVIRVPPLRERRDDIPMLVQEILEKLRCDMQIHEIPSIEPEIMSALKKYDWPGNVRELRNVLERALILSRGKELSLRSLGFEEDGARQKDDKKTTFTVSFPNDESINEITQDLKRFLVNEALRRAKGSRKGAAQMLGISRYSLKHYMKSLGYDDD